MPVRGSFLLLYSLFLSVLGAANEASTANGIDTIGSINPSQSGEFQFQQYDGKIIRRIDLVGVTFDLGFQDIDYPIIETSQKLLDKLHHRTRPEVIMKNIYLKPGEPLNPVLVSDNERFIRSMPYIQDARFQVVPVDNTDSVDLIVYTKDLFSFSGMVDGFGIRRQHLGLSNINISGTGQEVGLNVLHDIDRKPATGLQAYYGVQNVAGSFVDLRLATGTTFKNIYNKREDEFTGTFDLSLPLISQFSTWTGGIYFGRRASQNRYPDLYGTGLFDYTLNSFDFWVGYNLNTSQKDKPLGIKKVIAIRWVDHVFARVPDSIGHNDSRFLSNGGLLASLTLFQQYYQKANYLYQFGVTEDVPTGYNTSLVLGKYQHGSVSRPYIGLNSYFYHLLPNEDILGLFVKTGTFYREHRTEDLALMIGASAFLRLLRYDNFKLRNYFRLHYSFLAKREYLDPLMLNNSFGLTGFDSDLARGNHRLGAQFKSIFFINQRLFGFNIAPLAVADLIWLNPLPNLQHASGFFPSAGFGVRIKNENLQISTIELGLFLLPRKLAGDDYFSLTLLTNLDFKLRNDYVNKPVIVDLNHDPYDRIF